MMKRTRDDDSVRKHGEQTHRVSHIHYTYP